MLTDAGNALHRFAPAPGDPEPDPARSPVVLAHGMFSSHRALAPLARHLVARGRRVFAIDFRGHGAARQLEPADDFESAALVDVPDVLDTVAGLDGATRLDWIGHSGGGLALLMYLARRPDAQAALDRVVLAASQATGAGAGWVNRAKLRAIRAACFGRRRVDGRRFGVGVESEHAPALVQWVEWNLARRWHGRDGFDYLDALGAIELPALALAAGADRFIAPTAGCRAVHDALGGGRNRFVECARRAGFDDDFGHGRLVASRAAACAVWPLIDRWLADPVPT